MPFSGAGTGIQNADDVFFSGVSDGDTLLYNSGTAKWNNGPLANEAFTYALSDETTAITSGSAKITVRAPYTFTIDGVRASLTTASSSGAVVVDINKNGSTVLSTKLTIDQGERTSVSAATAAVISDAAVADDDELTFDIDTAGVSATGLKVTLLTRRG